MRFWVSWGFSFGAFRWHSEAPTLHPFHPLVFTQVGSFHSDTSGNLGKGSGLPERDVQVLDLGLGEVLCLGTPGTCLRREQA